MELRDLKYFCTAAELKSVTKAAGELGVSQPFVTKVITQMEREIGTQLFDIESRRIVLNAFGEVFYEKARKILDQMDDLMMTMDEMQGRSENTIHMLFNNAAYLGDITVKFHEADPSRVLSMTYAKRNDIIEALNTNKADFALTLPPISGEESKMIETITVFADYGSVLLPPDSPLLEKEYIELEDLSTLKYIISPRGSGVRDIMEYYFERYGMKPEIVYEASDFGLQVEMVKKGMGAAICSVMHKDDPAIGHLCRNIKINHAFGQVGISFNKYRHSTPLMEDFKAFITEFFNEMKQHYA